MPPDTRRRDGAGPPSWLSRSPPRGVGLVTCKLSVWISRTLTLPSPLKPTQAIPCAALSEPVSFAVAEMQPCVLIAFAVFVAAFAAQGAEQALAPEDAAKLVGEWVIEVRQEPLMSEKERARCSTRGVGLAAARRRLPPCRTPRLLDGSHPSPLQKDSMRWFSHGLYNLELERQFNETGACNATEVSLNARVH